jgi:beta-glucosidase
MTHNEPWVAAMAGYISGEHAPGIKEPVSGFKALHHMYLSHGLAAEAMRAAAKQPLKIGITLNLNPVHPASDSKRDTNAARRLDTGLNRMQLDPFLKGTSPLLDFGPGKLLSRGLVKSGDMEKMRDLDLLGVNYYTRTMVKYNRKNPLLSADMVLPVGNEYSGMWEIYPEGIYEILTRIWQDYYAPRASADQAGLRRMPEIMITENGVPVPDGLDFDGRVRDERRTRYLRDHLGQVSRAMQEGVPVKGYFHWSLMDNFEWALGFAPRFGLVYVDYPSLTRTIKDSGHWFARVIQDNGFEY